MIVDLSVYVKVSFKHISHLSGSHVIQTVLFSRGKPAKIQVVISSVWLIEGR